MCVEEGLCENTRRTLTTSQDVAEVTRSQERVSHTALSEGANLVDTWTSDFRPPERDVIGISVTAASVCNALLLQFYYTSCISRRRRLEYL